VRIIRNVRKFEKFRVLIQRLLMTVQTESNEAIDGSDCLCQKVQVQQPLVCHAIDSDLEPEGLEPGNLHSFQTLSTPRVVFKLEKDYVQSCPNVHAIKRRPSRGETLRRPLKMMGTNSLAQSIPQSQPPRPLASAPQPDQPQPEVAFMSVPTKQHYRSQELLSQLSPITSIPQSRRNRRFLVIVTMFVVAFHFLLGIYQLIEDVTDKSGFYFADPPNNSVAAIALANLTFEILALIAGLLIYIGTVQYNRLVFLKIGLILGWISITSLAALHSGEADLARANMRTILLQFEKRRHEVSPSYKELLRWLKGRISLSIVSILFNMIAWGFIMISGASMVYYNNSEYVGGINSFFNSMT